jgi:hypothetical protein
MVHFRRFLMIFVALAVASAVTTNVRLEGDIVKRDIPFILPVTGFVSAKAGFDKITMKIIRQVYSPGFCKKIEIINQPVPNTSPFMGSSEFTLIPEHFYNGRYAWSNGAETLSFIPTDGKDYGNWLIGNSPGVDNGYVYISADKPSLTPLGLEGGADNPDLQWKWLLNGVWKSQPQMRAVCKDTYKPGNSYFEIEYFDQITRNAVRSQLIPDLNPYILSLHNQLDKSFDYAAFLAKPSNLDLTFPAFYEEASQTWRLLENIMLLAEFGAPVLVSQAKQQIGMSSSNIGVLVNEEHSGKLGWRLVFKHFGFAHMQAGAASAASAANKAKRIKGKGGSSVSHSNKLIVESSIDHLDYVPSPLSHISHTGFFGKKGERSSTGAAAAVEEELVVDENEEEYTVEIDNTGCLDDYSLQPLPSPVRKNALKSMLYTFENIRPGEYMWIWYSNEQPQRQQNQPFKAPGNDVLHSVAIPRDVNQVSELLLRLKSRSNSTLVFEYYMTDRRDIMHQSVLERDTDFLVMRLPRTTAAATGGGNGGGGDNGATSAGTGTGTGAGAGVVSEGVTTATGGSAGGLTLSAATQELLLLPTVTFRGKQVQLKSVANLGSDILNYLRRFLLRKEGQIHGLSSCYMYHAAVSLPQALVYAAEILCVLLGSKPVTMVCCFFHCTI